MKKATVLTGLLLAFGVSQAWATTATCQGGNLATILATANFSCQVGDKIFSNFSYIDSATGGALAMPASGVTVDTLGPAGTLGADVLDANIGLEFNSSWLATAGQTSDSAIGFTVTVVGGANLLIEDFGLAQISGINGNALATVTEKGCGPATVNGVPCTPGALAVLTFDNGGPTSKTVNDTMFTPVSSVNVIKDINVNGGSWRGSFATISLVQDTFSQTSAVPEPATMLLSGIALCGLGLVRRKKQA